MSPSQKARGAGKIGSVPRTRLPAEPASALTASTEWAGRFRPLLAWFERAQRPLPWRAEPRDPYRVWLSEVMAQQTRIDVMLPYYARFLKALPTLESLAAAPLDQVLGLWSGLGYYSRARNLHRAAQAAAARGGLPRSSAELRALPGFGPYTAAAVASLAFGEQVPLVDGNVARVLARLLRWSGDADQVRKQAWACAPALLPPGRAAAFNEALMELGATVCTPRKPRCDACPLADQCASRAAGDAEARPAPKQRAARTQLIWASCVVTDRAGQLVLWRRPAGLFGGMWDLPSVSVGPEVSDEEAEGQLRAALLARGLRVTSLKQAGEVDQVLTHRELRLRVFAGRLRGPSRPAVDQTWLTPAQLRSAGLSSVARKALQRCEFPGTAAG